MLNAGLKDWFLSETNTWIYPRAHRNQLELTFHLTQSSRKQYCLPPHYAHIVSVDNNRAVCQYLRPQKLGCTECWTRNSTRISATQVPILQALYLRRADVLFTVSCAPICEDIDTTRNRIRAIPSPVKKFTSEIFVVDFETIPKVCVCILQNLWHALRDYVRDFFHIFWITLPGEKQNRNCFIKVSSVNTGTWWKVLCYNNVIWDFLPVYSLV